MAPKPINVNIKGSYDGKGTKDAIKDLTALAAAQAKVDAGATASATAAAKVAAAQSKQGQEAAKLTQAQARAAAEAAKLALAEQKVAAATQNTLAATARAEGASLRLAAAQARQAQATERAAATTRSWGDTVKGAAGNVDKFVGQVQGLAGAFAVVGAAKAAYEFARAGAAADASAKSFDNLAASAGTTGKALLSQLQAAASGTVANTDLIKSSNTALLLLGSDVATKLPALLAVAKASATTLGTDVGEVFNSLVTGISRGSTELIDNAGITLKAGDAYAAYAAEIGKSADSLSAAEKQQALLNGVLTAGQTIIQQTSGGAESAGVTFQRFEASVGNLSTAVASLVANGLAPLVAGLAEVAGAAASGIETLASMGDRLEEFNQSFVAGSGSYDEYLAKVEELNAALPPLVPTLSALSEGSFNAAKGFEAQGATAAEAAAQVAAAASTTELYNEALQNTVAFAPESLSAIQALGPALYEQATASDAGKAAVEQLLMSYNEGAISAAELEAGLMALAAANATSTVAAVEEARAERDGAVARQDSAAAALEATNASLDKAAADQVAQAQAELLAVAEQNLMAAAQAAAAGQGTAQSAAATLAAQFGISTARALELVNALRMVAAASGGPTGAAFTATEGRAERDGAAGRASIGSMRAVEAQQARLAATRAAETKAARPTRASGGGGGGGGGGGAAAAQAKEAQKGAEQLAAIAQKTGARLAEINAQTAEKLIAIDAKAAAERARIAQQLANDIATSTRQMVAQQEANDLELIGVEDEGQQKRLAAREQAEAEARARQEALNAETLSLIQNGEVERAEAEREVKEKANQQRQALDESYYAKQAELAGNPEALAALEVQYQEAVAAQQAATDAELTIAQAKVEAKKAAAEQEKAEVIAQAMEQKEGVIQAAVDQAEGVKGASAGQREAVVGDLQAQAGAATNWASATEAAAARVAAAAAKAAQAIANMPSPPSGGGGGGGAPPSGGGGTAAAGGGTFLTSGPTSLTVGDNPGGVEVVQVTPVSGRGQTRVGGGMAKLAGGGTLVASGGGRSGVESSGRRGAGGGGGPLAQIQQALAAGDVASLNLDKIKDYADKIKAVKDILEGLGDIASLASTAGASGVVAADLTALAAEANAVLAIVTTNLIPTTKKDAEALGLYADALGDAVGVLTDIADLQATLAASAAPPAHLAATVQALAREALIVIQAIQQTLQPATLSAVAGLERYQAGVEAAIGIVSATLDLRERMADMVGVRNYFAETVSQLAGEARVVADEVRKSLVPTSQRAADELDRWAETATRSLTLITGVLDLRERMVAIAGVRNYFAETISQLGGEARVVVDELRKSLIPLSEEEAAAVSAWAETTGAAISVVKDAIGLRDDMFTDYRPPSAAQIGRVVADSRRVAAAFTAAARTMDGEGSEQARAFADAAASAVGAAREGLLAIAAINDSGFELDPKRLATFERNSMAVLDSLGRIGERAVTIPGGAIAAATDAAGAVKAQSEALQALAGVPGFALAGANQGGGGGGGTTNTVTFEPNAIVIYQQPGQSAQQLVDQVVAKVIPQVRQALTAGTNARR